jgi:molybdopterin-binding protein
MPRKEQGWITFQSSEEERQILEQYCQQSQRSKTDILRELLRNLTTNPVKTPKKAQNIPPEVDLTQAMELRFSARNMLRGVIKQVIWGAVNVEIKLEVAPGLELISVITKASAEELGLEEGLEVYAVIKSNNIMIARYC